MATKLQPLADRIVVKPIKAEEVSRGGIVLPDTAKEKPQEGEIIAIGPGRTDEAGKRNPYGSKGRGYRSLRQIRRHRSKN